MENKMETVIIALTLNGVAVEEFKFSCPNPGI